MTSELDTQENKALLNGHDSAWKTFSDDQALLRYITEKKPAEEDVELPEWEVVLTCRALTSEMRIKIQIAAYDEKTKRVDYRNVFDMIVQAGCYNPVTKNRVFGESSRPMLRREQDGAAIERLALVILRLSCMLTKESEQVKKN